MRAEQKKNRVTQSRAKQPQMCKQCRRWGAERSRAEEKKLRMQHVRNKVTRFAAELKKKQDAQRSRSSRR